MFEINRVEKLKKQGITAVRGMYNNKPYLITLKKDNSYMIDGSFTVKEKEELIKAYFNTLF